MLVELRSLKPNPTRDFIVDPIDDEVVARLKQSIKDYGFWGGVVGRRLQDGTRQIGAGHHRVIAALEAGIKTADITVLNEDQCDDEMMMRMYAVENATQRGNNSTAQNGSVASAVRLIAKAVLTGQSSKIFELSEREAKQFTNDQGLGQAPVVRFLDGVPGINSGTVMQSLASLKDSGDYARIIHEVQEEIEHENKEALKALEEAEEEQKQLQHEQEEAVKRQKAAEATRKEASARAKTAQEETEKKRAKEELQRAKQKRQQADDEAAIAEKRRKEADEEMKKFEDLRKTRDAAAKAAEAANGKPRVFDLEGVSVILKNPHQLDVFRKQVTGPGIAPYLPVENQAGLAKQLVDLAAEQDRELSGAFIRENLATLVMQVKHTKRTLDKEESKQLLQQSLQRKMDSYQDDFSRNCRGMAASGNRIVELLKEWPKDLPFAISTEFRNALKIAKTVIDILNEKI